MSCKSPEGALQSEKKINFNFLLNQLFSLIARFVLAILSILYIVFIVYLKALFFYLEYFSSFKPTVCLSVLEPKR